MASEIKVDTISEKTSANGVTIDGVSLKDSKIATANSVDSDAYVDGSIDAVHLSANSVDSDAYVDASIDNAHLADDAVDTAELASGAVTMDKLDATVTEADNVVQRVCKAWVNFVGSDTVTINDDFNVSSITDNSEGNYTVNLSTSLGSDHGVMSGYAHMDGLVYGDINDVSSAGTFRMRTVVPSTNANFDPDEVHVIIFGDS